MKNQDSELNKQFADWDDIMEKKKTVNLEIDPESVKNIESFKDFIPADVEDAIKELYETHPELCRKHSSKGEDWIQTYSGKKLYPFNPNINSICIEDIAHSLSMLCRFTGHIKSFYSVAQHSVLVSQNCDSDFALEALLHDASEYALQDIPAPLKKTDKFKEYKFYEKQLQSLIYRKFHINEIESAHVKEIDLKMLSTEVRDLFQYHREDFKLEYLPFDFKINPLPPKAAEHLFLYRFYELTMHNWV